jgi:hypothetical protein
LFVMRALLQLSEHLFDGDVAAAGRGLAFHDAVGPVSGRPDDA